MCPELTRALFFILRFERCSSMLHIYPVMLDWIASLAPVLRAVRSHDSNLADQLRRCSTSVVLNTAEGMGATGRVKLNCYRIALREMREAVAVVEVAGRLGYFDALGDEAVDRQDRIVGTLVRLAKPQ